MRKLRNLTPVTTHQGGLLPIPEAARLRVTELLVKRKEIEEEIRSICYGLIFAFGHNPEQVQAKFDFEHGTYSITPKEPQE